MLFRLDSGVPTEEEDIVILVKEELENGPVVEEAVAIAVVVIVENGSNGTYDAADAGITEPE
jgi:hypothetical protein